MGRDLETARALARGWWELDVAERSRRRGWAHCDAAAGHRVAVGEGCLCRPIKPIQKAPDLVCESCFHDHPYEPWDGGRARVGAEAGGYLTVDEALATLGKKVERPEVAPEPVSEGRRRRRGVGAPEAPRSGAGRAFLACLVAGGAGGTFAALASNGPSARPEASLDGLIVGVLCGLAAWLAALILRRADLSARGRGTSPDRPDAAWRLTPLSALIGGALAVLGRALILFLIGGGLFRVERMARYAERAVRFASDPIAPAALGVAVAALLATLLPWMLANLRGLGRGMGAVDGLARIGALIGAVVAGGLAAGLVTLRPDLIPFDQNAAAPWVIYAAPVLGYGIGAHPRNGLVRGLAGALFAYGALGVLASVYRPDVDPTGLDLGRLGLRDLDPRGWDAPGRTAFCLGLPVAGALLGTLLSRRLLGGALVLLAATLAGGFAILALATFVPEVATRAPGALENVLTDVPAALGARTVVLGLVAGLFAVAGVALGFGRGMLAAWVGLASAYGLAYLGFVVIAPALHAPGSDVLGDALRRGLGWAGMPAVVLAPLAGYLLGRGRFAALAAGVLGYGLGWLAALPASEALGVDVAGDVGRSLGLPTLVWPALLAVGGVSAGLGVIAAVVSRALGRRWATLRHVNKFDCAWCGRTATRDARPAPAPPPLLLPVCGDPLCNRELAALLADPTARSLVDGPLRLVSPAEAPELPEAVQEKAAPGRVERLRRLAQAYRPLDT